MPSVVGLEVWRSAERMSVSESSRGNILALVTWCPLYGIEGISQGVNVQTDGQRSSSRLKASIVRSIAFSHSPDRSRMLAMVGDLPCTTTRHVQ